MSLLVDSTKILGATALPPLTAVANPPDQTLAAASSSSSAVVGRTTPLLSFSMVHALQQTRVTGVDPWMVEFSKDMPELPEDRSSNAEPKKAITTHLKWDVEAPDYANKVLKAKATYTYKNLVEGNDTLVLDTKGLVMSDIQVNGNPGLFTVELKKDMPDRLSIKIPSNRGSGEVSISYSTSPNASGIYWIEKEYTEGKQHPMLYTLFEATEGASVIPGQHTPQVRLTYEINANSGDKDLMVLSSVSNNPINRSADGKYEGLRMGRAVPLYLLSLHAGNFVYRGYDSKTGVYAEEAMIDEASKALEKLPQFMTAAEKECGPYNWGKYTPIIMCWAFPYMAMEHPCASTCGAVCLEQIKVLIHELSHSWSGNDTTNCNWQQFVWNEGLTCYFEYILTAEIYDKEYAAMEFLCMWEDAKEAMDEFRQKDPEQLKLCHDGEFKFTRIPYAKGALFFFMLQKAIGEQEFKQFLQDYMKVFFQNTMSDKRFLKFLELWLKNKKGVEDFEAFKTTHKIDQWLYGVEMPENTPVIKSSLLEAVKEQVDKVLANQDVDVETIKGWDIATQLMFINKLKGATRYQLQQVDEKLQYTASKSMSIHGGWAQACAKAGYFNEATEEMIVNYVIKRNSLHQTNMITKPLSGSEEGKKVARRILDEENGRLFPIVKQAIQKNLAG